MVTTRRVRHGLVLALVGLLAGLGIVSGLYWEGSLSPLGEQGASSKLPAATLPEKRSDAAAPPAASPGAPPTAAPKDERAEAKAQDPAPASPPGPAAAPAKPAEAAEPPRFDLVRVEPNGDAVIAGRGKPNTVVEMLVDGKPVARALADPNGQFAIVPPPLPKGSSEIVLRSKTADGQESRSAQSVAVSVSPEGNTRPLVALSAPDAPTVVLSQPGVPETPPVAAARPGDTAAPKTGQIAKAPDAAKAADPTVPTRIVSVDSEAGGKLFVTGTGAPGSEIRLYLNDTLIAPATIGPDGRVTFTIGRGVAEGRYQVRLDQVDPKTGAVLHRAEVPFAMPQALADAAEPRHSGRVGAHATAPGGVASQGGAGTTGSNATPAPDRAQPGASNSARVEGEERGGRQDGRIGGDRAEAGGGVPGAAPTEGRSGSSASGTPRDSMAALSSRDRPPAMSGDASTGSRAGAVFVAEISTAKIVRGDNLWQISRRTYGRGDRYTVIYDANQTQIRNPDLIYPGQIFVLPNDRRG